MLGLSFDDLEGDSIRDWLGDGKIVDLKIKGSQIRGGLAQMIAREIAADPDNFVNTSHITVNGREVPVPPALMAQAQGIANQDSESFWDETTDVPAWLDGGSGGEFVFSEIGIQTLLSFIWSSLQTHSPIGVDLHDRHPGLYAESHVLLMDGNEVDPAMLLSRDVDLGGDNSRAESGTTFVFYNKLPYAGKIETGESPQFPDGVYQAVAVLAQQESPAPGVFNPTGTATVSFAWDGPDGAPAITVKRPTFS